MHYLLIDKNLSFNFQMPRTLLINRNVQNVVSNFSALNMKWKSYTYKHFTETTINIQENICLSSKNVLITLVLKNNILILDFFNNNKGRTYLQKIT